MIFMTEKSNYIVSVNIRIDDLIAIEDWLSMNNTWLNTFDETTAMFRTLKNRLYDNGR